MRATRQPHSIKVVIPDLSKDPLGSAMGVDTLTLWREIQR